MKRNRGFELVEALVTMAFIGITASILISFIFPDCPNDSKDCTKKEEVAKPATSSIADKFNKEKPTAPIKETGYNYTFTDKDFETKGHELTIEEACGDIPDSEAMKNCKEAFNRDRYINNCIKSYSNE